MYLQYDDLSFEIKVSFEESNNLEILHFLLQVQKLQGCKIKFLGEQILIYYAKSLFYMHL